MSLGGYEIVALVNFLVLTSDSSSCVNLQALSICFLSCLNGYPLLR